MNHGFLRLSLLLVFAFVSLLARAAATPPFTDNFNGPLNSAWQVLQGLGHYTVGNGQLRYYNQGSLASTTGWYQPALTLGLPFTGTNWELDTKVTYNLAWCTSGNYTGPSVPNQSCSSGAQGPEILVAFKAGTLASSYGGPNYAGSDYLVCERVVDAWYGSNALSCSYGNVTNGNMLNPADATIRNNITGPTTYWFKIIRNDGILTVRYSTDGATYITAFSTPLANPASSYNELLLGGITYETAGSFATYSYVHITQPACKLADAPVYNAASGALTMNFTIDTPSPATWNVWLVSQNSATLLWSQTQPVADPPLTVTKTHSLVPSGGVGILSTLTTADEGITCSSWQVINTATQ